MKKVKRILILGGPGSGKTTLANQIAKILELPIIHLDSINYKQDWLPRDTKERDKIIIEEAKKDEWIMEGVYKTTLKERANLADIIIFLECSTVCLMCRVIKRYVCGFGKEKNELQGCKERLSLEFIKYALRFNSKKKSIYNILSNVDNIQDKLIIIRKGKIENKQKLFLSKMFK